jgi:WbqC-like protein family
VPVCVISQPRFFPGLHYLHRMMLADVFVILDTVQFSPRHEENRTRVKTSRGQHWLTVPVRQVTREQRILDTRIDNSQPWRRKAMRTLAADYGKARCYPAHAVEVTSILGTPTEMLTELDTASWGPALRSLEIACRFVRASTLPIHSRGSRLLLDICRWIGADVYLSGGFGRDYLDLEAFAAAGVAVRFHEYTYPIYPQCFGEFMPWLSYLDMLFNAGLDRETVAAGGTTRLPLVAAGAGSGSRAEDA